MTIEGQAGAARVMTHLAGAAVRDITPRLVDADDRQQGLNREPPARAEQPKDVRD